MANSKISALTSATTPLAGTETLPVVQSGTTKQVSVANLTAGRSVAAQALSLSNTETYLGMTATNAGGKLWYAISGGGGNVSPGYFCLFNGTSGNKVMSIAPSTSEQFVTDTSGNFNMIAGNVVQGTAAKGFNFTANTPAAGKTSQLLNWYEEGTWTPSVSSTVGTITLLGAVSGTYTRIGRRVFINFSIAITTNGTAAGGILVSGLPFTISGFGSGSGRENGVNGYMIQSAGFNGATQFYILTYLGLYPGGSGYLLEGFMEYQV